MSEHRRAKLENKCSMKKIDVIIVCEAKRDERVQGFLGYLQLVQNQTIMFLRDTTRFQVLEDYCICLPYLETIAIETSDMVFISAYCRDGSKPHGVKKLIQLMMKLTKVADNVCVIGDLNAKYSHVYDVGSSSNAAGKYLDYVLEQNLFCVALSNATGEADIAAKPFRIAPLTRGKEAK